MFEFQLKIPVGFSLSSSVTCVSDKKISEFKSQVDRIFATGAVRGVPTLIDAKDLGL